jgi:hypothetical protein
MLKYNFRRQIRIGVFDFSNETRSGVNIIKLFTLKFTNVGYKLKCLSLVGLSGIV